MFRFQKGYMSFMLARCRENYPSSTYIAAMICVIAGSFRTWRSTRIGISVPSAIRGLR